MRLQVCELVNLFHRYVFRNVFVSCLAAVSMFAFLVLALSVVKDMLNLLAEGQLTFRAFFKLIWLYLPFVFVYCLPMGFITGILLAMGRMSAEQEITSLRAAGVSIARLSSSVFVLAILGTGLSLVVNFYYGPLAKTEYRSELRNTIQTNPLGFIVEKTFVREFPGTVIYVSEKDGDILHDIWIWDLDDQGRVERFSRAERGRFRFVEDSNDLELMAENVSLEIRDDEDPENFQSKNFIAPTFERLPFSFSLDRILGKETLQRKLSHLTFAELVAYMAEADVARAEAEGADKAEAERNYLQARMTFHRNFASGFAVLSFACLAIPLGIKTSRKETSVNLGIGLGLGILYYLFMISFDWLDTMPQLRPELLYWGPNVIYQSLGAWLLIRSDHGKGKKKSKQATAPATPPKRSRKKARRGR